MTRLASPNPDPNAQGLRSSHIRPLEPTFSCFACHHDFGPNDVNLDAQNNLICGACYGANPPIVDVEIIFAQVIVHMSDES